MKVATGTPGISAVERLRVLPALFRGADLTLRFGWTSNTVEQCLSFWKTDGLVDGLGGHSGIYANLLVDASPNWDLALRILMPSAVIVGIEALRRGGWTTQIPQRYEVAVNAEQTVFETDRYEIAPREASWFAHVEKAFLQVEEGLPALPPPWALADLLSRGSWGSFGLDPDDIEWDAVVEQDNLEWAAACRTLGMPLVPLASLVERSRDYAMPGRRDS